MPRPHNSRSSSRLQPESEKNYPIGLCVGCGARVTLGLMTGCIAKPRLPELARGSQLATHLTIEASSAVLALHGEADLATVEQLQAALDSTSQTGASRLVLDWAGLEFIDCASLGVIATWRRTHPHVPVHLRNVGEFQAKILEIVGWGDLIDRSC